MILNLKNILFTTDPLEILKEKNISKKEWEKIWYKRKFLDYQINELVEYIQTIYKKDINCKQLSRYINRYELYQYSQPLLKQKEETIHISYFPQRLVAFIKDYYHE